MGSSGILWGFFIGRSGGLGPEVACLLGKMAISRRLFVSAGERRGRAFEPSLAAPPVATRNGLAQPTRIGAPQGSGAPLAVKVQNFPYAGMSLSPNKILPEDPGRTQKWRCAKRPGSNGTVDRRTTSPLAVRTASRQGSTEDGLPVARGLTLETLRALRKSSWKRARSTPTPEPTPSYQPANRPCRNRMERRFVQEPSRTSPPSCSRRRKASVSNDANDSYAPLCRQCIAPFRAWAV